MSRELFQRELDLVQTQFVHELKAYLSSLCHDLTEAFLHAMSIPLPVEEPKKKKPKKGSNKKPKEKQNAEKEGKEKEEKSEETQEGKAGNIPELWSSNTDILEERTIKIYNKYLVNVLGKQLEGVGKQRTKWMHMAAFTVHMAIRKSVLHLGNTTALAHFVDWCFVN